jgi:Nuclease-related domain
MANSPGESTRRLANARYMIRLILVAAAICLLVLIARNGMKTHTVIGFVSCLFAMIGLDKLVIPLLDKLISREKQAVRGAKAEETVGAILDRLPSNHRVLHDVQKDFGNIDHLVFRSDGAIFLIETKSHHGTVTVQNGELRRDGLPFEKNFVNQTLDNATWLKRFLKTQYRVQQPWIHAAVVFTDAYVPRHCELHNVAIIHRTYLERWMAKQRGNPEQRMKLWPQVDAVEAQLLGTARILANAPHVPSVKTSPVPAPLV